MKRDYNRVEYIYRDSRLPSDNDMYGEMNCDNKPIHMHFNDYDYWLRYDDNGRKIHWKDSEGNETEYSYDEHGNCQTTIIHEDKPIFDSKL